MAAAPEESGLEKIIGIVAVIDPIHGKGSSRYNGIYFKPDDQESQTIPEKGKKK